MEETTYYSIDRFEGDFAVCECIESGQYFNILKKLLPINSKSGDIIYYKNGIYYIDIKQTKIEQDKIKSLVNNLFKKKNK